MTSTTAINKATNAAASTQRARAYQPTPEESKALSKAKIQLMRKPDSVFFTTLCFSLRHVFDPTVPTACTNGRQIRISPRYFMGLSLELQISLLIHETMHCAYMHMGRLAGRDPLRWNYATDYVINLQLHERGFHIGPGWLLDTKYAGMSADEVYKLLEDEDLEMLGNPIGGDLEEPTEDPDLEKDITDIVVRARIQSKMSNDKPGTIPGDIELLLDKILNPKLPWQRILQKYLQKFNKSDYSFRRPNRRFFPKHHLPSLWGESLIDLAVAVDISGSVSDEEFNRFVSEIAGILRMMMPEKITLIQFDTNLKSVDVVKNVLELVNVPFTGRGGTKIQPVMEWCEKNNPQCLMVFTDGEFRFPLNTLRTDTVWLIHNNPGWKAPWGKTIHYQV